jgi:putative PEP-CTERM system TPR-repeat lipoprotein
MGKQGRTRFLAATALIAPILMGLATGGACAAVREADFYLRSAERLLQNNDLRGAEIQLRNAAQRAPQDGAIRMQLAEIYMRQGNINAAEAELTAAKQRGVTDERLAMLLVQVMYAKGEYGPLLRDVPAGNRTAEVESVVRNFRGLAELAVGQNDDARTMLEDAERLAPKSVFPKISMARLFLFDRNLDAAERKIDEALAIGPRDSRALDVKGVILLSRGDKARALTSFNDALKERPGSIQVLLDRANLYLSRGDIDLAEKDVKAVEMASANSATAIYLDALISSRRGNYQAADASLTKFRPLMDQLPDSYLLAGFVKYNLNQIEQAEAYLTRFIARRKDKVQAYQLLGAIALRQGNADRAIAMLDQALSLEPKSPDTMSLLAQAHMARGDSGRAMALLDQAVKEQPDNANLKTELAVTRLSAGETGTALVELSDVFKSGSGNTLAGPPLVLAALREGRTDQAATTAEILVKQNPNNLVYQQLLGVTRVAQRDLPVAEKIFRGILDKQPNSPAMRRNLAQIYLAMNRPADAKKVFQDKIAKDTNDVDSMQGLADLYLADKDYDAAASLLARAANAAPADPAPRLRLVSVYGTQKKWPDALKEARALAAAFSGNVAVRDTLGRVYFQSGDLPNSLATYREAVRAFPNSSQLQASYAAVASASKDYPTAINALNKAIALDNRNDSLKAALVDVSYQSKGLDAALATAKSFGNGNPDNPIGDVLAADVLDRNGKRAEAIALLEKAQAAKGSAALVMKLASFHERNKDMKRSIAVLEGWAKNHPADIAPRFQLAQSYSVVGNYGAARVEFEKLAAERPSDAVVLNNLAWIYGKTNDARARKTAERAHQLAPDSAEVSDTLGWIMTAQGEAANAMKYLQLALDRLPQDLDVQYHFALALSRTNRPGEARALLQKTLASKDDFDSKAEAKQLFDRLSAGAGSSGPPNSK